MSAQPIPLPLFSPLGSRDATATKDARLLNGFVEKTGEEALIFKRPSFTIYDAVGSGFGRGCFNWLHQVYSVFGTTLYKEGVAVGTVDGGSQYSFTSCLGATPRLFLKNNSYAYVYDPIGGLVQVTSPNYPINTVPGAVYLDGTIYVLDPYGNIYGSELNDPLTWEADNLIVAQIEPDTASALMKQLVYVCAVKEHSVEVFYDAGNAEGSPLGSVQGAKVGVGTRASGSVTKVGDDVCWIGNTDEGTIQAMSMQRVKAEAISTPPVDRLLVGTNYTTVYSWAARIAGHRLYAFTSVGTNRTLIFDLSQNLTYIWTDPSGNFLPFVSATHDVDAKVVLQHATDGRLYTTHEDLFQDQFSGSAAIPVDVYTQNFDGGLQTNKTCAYVEVVADWIDTTVLVSWSDDDYQTWTAPQSLNLAQPHPILQDGSTFRRRAYRVTHSGNTPLRLKRLELMLDAGTF